jgi:predicted RNase H-like nuclease (RuvC/YqgF family)
MVTTPYGLNDPTKPPSREPVKCIVKGCENNADPGSVTMLCMQCCHVVSTGDMVWYHANYMGKNWISDTVMKIFHTREDNKELEEHNEYLEGVIKELKQEVKDLEDDRDNAYFLADGSTLSVNDLRTFYHENQALKEGHKNKDQFIDSLRKEIEALNYNIDHAHKDGDRFLTVDDLCIFYQENKKIHDVVQQQHNRIVLLGLQLKKANETIKHQDETIQAFKKELDSMESKLAKGETFATKTKEHLDKKAEAAEQNMKFEAYTNGFWKGFDMGYEKAKDQYYE